PWACRFRAGRRPDNGLIFVIAFVRPAQDEVGDIHPVFAYGVGIRFRQGDVATVLEAHRHRRHALQSLAFHADGPFVLWRHLVVIERLPRRLAVAFDAAIEGNTVLPITHSHADSAGEKDRTIGEEGVIHP